MASKSFVCLTVLALLALSSAVLAQDSPGGATSSEPTSQKVLSTASELAPVTGPPAPAPAEQVVQLPPGVVALVNNQPISEKEWVDTCKRVAGPSILLVMINHVVVQQAAEAKGIKVTNEEVQTEYDKALSKAGGMENLMASLQESGESEVDFKVRLRTNALLYKLIEKEEVAVADDDVRKMYLERYGRKAEVQVIVVQTQADADSIVTRVRRSEDFGTLALQESIDEYTARNHGYLPIPVSDGFFPKPFGRVVITDVIADMLFKMKRGEVSPPVSAGEGGFFVFRVTDIKDAAPVAFDTVKVGLRDEARAAVFARKATERLEQLIAASTIEVGIPMQ